MIILRILLLLLFLKLFPIILAIDEGWCTRYNVVTRTRIEQHVGEKEVKWTFLWIFKYYETVPYVYTKIVKYYDTKVINECPQNSHCVGPNECDCNEGYDMIEYLNDTNFKCVDQDRVAEVDLETDIMSNEDATTETSSNEDTSTAITSFAEDKLDSTEDIMLTTSHFSSTSNPKELSSTLSSKSNNNGEFIPRCDQECPQNSKCVGPNECDCNEGYDMIEYLNDTNFKCVSQTRLAEDNIEKITEIMSNEDTTTATSSNEDTSTAITSFTEDKLDST